MLAIRWHALPLAVLPVYFILGALKGCSGTGGPDRLPTEPLPTEGTRAQGGPSSTDAGSEGPGSVCPSPGATKPGSETTSSSDVCVTESCNGNRTCTTFPIVVEKRTGTLRCVAKDGAATWEWDGPVTAHRVERA